VTVLSIVEIGHPILRERAREVDRSELETAETQAFVDDLIETMRSAKGAGLAAPQVERSIRICVIEVQRNPRYPYFPEIPLQVLVNPVVTPRDESTIESYEGCLSVPRLRGLVRRSAHVAIRASDRYGAALSFEARGLAAAVFQHEIDHLDGTLFVDRVLDPRSLTTTESFDRFHRDAYLRGLAEADDRDPEP
jgi:peptide deformylase